MLHVPFRTSPEALTAVLGKRVDVMFDTVSAVLGQVQSGELKPLAVTGKDRFPAVPNVPAAIESGVVPGFDVVTWYGMIAPAGTPPDIVGKLNAALNAVIADPAVARTAHQGGRAGVGVHPGRLRRPYGVRIRPLGQGPRGRRHRPAIAESASRAPPGHARGSVFLFGRVFFTRTGVHFA